MDKVKQLLVNDWYSAKATKLKSPSCRTVLVLILWGATKWDKPAKWEGSPLARLVPLRGPLLYCFLFALLFLTTAFSGRALQKLMIIVTATVIIAQPPSAAFTN